MSVTYVKFCPICQTSTALDTAICAHCGHQFRSRLSAPVSEKTIAMTPQDLPPSLSAHPSPGRMAPEKRVRMPRPLLALVLGIVALSVVAGVLISHAASHHPPVRDGAALMSASGSPPYDAVFQPVPGQQMIPVATRKVDDLQRWLQLQQPVNSKAPGIETKSDYPETVHLYLSGRILLIASGTPARVLTDMGSWRQVRILGGEHTGMTGYAPREALLRSGIAVSGAPKQTLTIP